MGEWVGGEEMEDRLCTFKVNLGCACNVFMVTTTPSPQVFATLLFPPHPDPFASPPVSASFKYNRIAGQEREKGSSPSQTERENESNSADKEKESNPFHKEKEKEKGTTNSTITTTTNNNNNNNDLKDSPIAEFSLGASAEFRLAPGPFLFYSLLHKPLVITLHWISPSGLARGVLGESCVDLSPLLLSPGSPISGAYPLLTPPNTLPPLPNEEKPYNADKKDPKAKRRPSSTKQPQEVPPVLLETTSVTLTLSSDVPVLSDSDREEGILIEFDVVGAYSLPESVTYENHLFTFELAFPIPGYTASWWDSVNTSLPDPQKDMIAIARLTEGELQTMSIDSNVATIDGTSPTIESINPPSCENGSSIVWKTGVKRFLPSLAVKELKQYMRKREKWQGEMARYPKSENDFFEPNFKRYQAFFEIDLSPLLEEGVTESVIICPLEDISKQKLKSFPLMRVPEIKQSAKPIDPSPTVGIIEQSENNVWKDSGSYLKIRIRTSHPFEPVWVPPPEPSIALADLIPPRPKLPNLNSSLEMAMHEFRSFVKVGAQTIASTLQSLLTEEKLSRKETESTSFLQDRVRNQERLKKLLHHEMQKAGLWNQIREDMKQKVFNVVNGKLKPGNSEDNNSLGDVEFCNAIYVQLVEEIHSCITNLETTRKRSFFNFLDNFDQLNSKKVHTLESLRRLADEYEADGDFWTANKCYQERIIEDKSNPDIWFEYGAYCMRGDHKDLAKAEECFKESISLCEEHALSLLALSCLMWHRGLLQQAEILLHTVIDLHPQEEFIPWVILSQIYVAQGHKINSSNCLRKAETLHTNWKASGISKSCPHDLSSCILRHPFSVASPMTEDYASNGPYLDAALLLLDLHLPTEANQVLCLEHVIFSSSVDYKLCFARAYELLRDYNKSEESMKEATVLSYSDTLTWRFFGHLKYKQCLFKEAIDAYGKMLQHLGDKTLDAFTLAEIGKCYLAVKNYEKAKQVFLKSCSSDPRSSAFWLGAGIAYYKMGDTSHAEAALIEANALDPWNFKIWAYLALLCLSTERVEEAELAFHQSIKTFISLPLLLELADAFTLKNRFSIAEIALARALRESDDVNIRVKLEDTLSKQGKIEVTKLDFQKDLEVETLDEKQRLLSLKSLQDMHASV